MANHHQLQWALLFILIVWGMSIGTSPPLFSASPKVFSDTIVISQIYGAGGNSGATYQNDFIELFNRGTSSVSLTGWSVQYASATSSSWSKTDLTGTLAPGQYFLIKQDSGGASGAPLPTADVTGTISLSASVGKVALINSATTLAASCPLSNPTVIDFVGYGVGANCFEGAAVAPSSSNNTSSTQRLTYGCTETDDNRSDFATGVVQPHNSTTPIFSCGLPPENLLITEVLYDSTQTDEGDEFVELVNPFAYTVTLTGYKIGDEEIRGNNEGMYGFPPGATIAAGATLILARNAAQFRAHFGFDPNYELVTSGVFTDTLGVPNLVPYSVWGSGVLALANDGDEVLLLGPGDQIVDSVAWGSQGNFAVAGVRGHASAPAPLSLQRYATLDTNNMSLDFMRDAPSPGTLRMRPSPPAPIPGVTMPNGMLAYWGDLHAHSTASDGAGPPRMAFDTARANGLHFFTLTDHDAWLDAEEWTEIGNAAGDATVDYAFVALRAFEWTHATQGHINVYNSTTWVSRDDPNYDTLAEFYAWLGSQSNILAQFNHPTYSGTFNDFAYDSAASEKIRLVEMGNNGRVPYERYEAQYPQALNQRWRVAPTIGSDHHGLIWGNASAHRVGILAPTLTTANVLDALRARRSFATEDANLALALQANGVWMGETISAATAITFTITARDPDSEPLTLELYDNGALVATQAFPDSNTIWNVVVPGYGLHYYYVRAVQSDGDIAYTAPIWTAASPGLRFWFPFIRLAR